MTKDDLRKHFDLQPCPNKAHSFQVRKLIGEWVMAKDCWSSLVDNRLNTYHFSFHSIKSVEGNSAYSLVVWKLKVIWSFLP